ncbi:MAG: hypothetical protein ACTHU0_14005 [Kofleriaceae bacterium]
MRIAIVIAMALAIAAGSPGSAEAYPQYQLSGDSTCTGCHVSPAGGNLLNENGLAFAEVKSQFGTAPEFFYNKVPLPSWLMLGGDLRGTAGYMQTPEKAVAAFPMQVELYAHTTFGAFSAHVTAGYRPPMWGNEGATRFWSREHYLMWQQNPGESTGLYVRAGRFVPVFGLRFAEHPLYTRRFGGTPLYSDTYGVHAAYIQPRYEAHLTGFIEDPLIDPVLHTNGAAGYAEYRITERLQLGAEGMIEVSADDKKLRGGLVGKFYEPGLDLLFSLEAQFVNQRIDAGGAPNQLIGNFVVSKPFAGAFLLDVGLGHFDSNIRIRDLDRDCVDLNLHWFTTSHLELVVNARYELLGFGNGGPSGGYALLQAHYRL